MIRIALFVIISFWSVNHYITNLTFLGAGKAASKHDYLVAKKLLNSTIKREPRFYKAYYLRGQINIILEKKKEGIRDLLICEYLCPDFGITRKMLNE